MLELTGIGRRDRKCLCMCVVPKSLLIRPMDLRGSESAQQKLSLSQQHRAQSRDNMTTLQVKMDANIVVLGTENVGKSALTVRLLTRRFIGEYGEIESIYSHNFDVDGREIGLNIWDSPHSTDISVETSLFEKRLQWADGFILVYSICDRTSFNTVTKLIQAIKAAKSYLNTDKVPIVIVGNKRDLDHRRTVLSEEGRLLALATDCHFYEVSAAENYHGVLTVFHGLVDTLDRTSHSKCVTKRPLGFRGIMKSMSAVFSRRRTDSL